MPTIGAIPSFLMKVLLMTAASCGRSMGSMRADDAGPLPDVSNATPEPGESEQENVRLGSTGRIAAL
jgi:hypothetical protein